MKIKSVTFITFIILISCTKVIEPESKKEHIFVAAQGFDQVNILSSIDGFIQNDQEIISVNFIENMMETPHFIEIDIMKLNKLNYLIWI